MSSPSQDFVRYALSVKALELIPEGRKLKSGRISPYFFNSGLFKSGQTAWHLSLAYANTIRNLGFDTVFGPAYKGIPLAVSIALCLFRNFNFDAGYAYNRKEEKDHGEGGLIIGSSLAGKRVVIVDDVVTAGGTADETIDFVQKNGGTVVGYAVAFDRQERWIEYGAQSAIEAIQQKHDISVVSAATLSDLISILERDPEKEDILAKILAYRDRYGVG